MPINDFAGPIIQAFLTGQQIKRQREQDIIAQQDRERQIKEQLRQVARQEQQDKVAATMNRMQVENMLRGEIAQGIRTIPIEAMQAPGGVATPQVSPIAQQLLEPSTGQELPLQQVQRTQIPIQFGPEFAIPETQRVQQPMLDLPGIGQIDLRQFPTYEQTQARKRREQAASMLLKAEEAGLVAGAQEEAKAPSRKQEQEAKAASAAQVANIRAKGQQAVAEKRLEFQNKQLSQTIAHQAEMASIARGRLNQTISKAATKKATTMIDKVDTEKEILDSALAVAREGNVSREELLTDVPLPLRAKMLSAVQSAGIPLLTKKQIEGKAEFSAARNLLEEVMQLNNQINAEGWRAGLPLTKSSAMFEEVKAKTEGLARDFLQMRGVLSNADIERAFGVIVKPTIFKESSTNPRRIQTLINDIGAKFKAAYGSLPKDEQVKILQETGLFKYLSKEVR